MIPLGDYKREAIQMEEFMSHAPVACVPVDKVR